jgi:Ras-related protein Rab-5C
MYYRGAAAALVVFDLTHAPSFDRARKWVAELRASVAGGGPVIALVANKADLAEQRAVSEDEARAYAAEADLLYFEASAKDNVNVTEAFEAVAERLPRPAAPELAAPGGVRLDDAPAPAARRAGACCS